MVTKGNIFSISQEKQRAKAGEGVSLEARKAGPEAQKSRLIKERVVSIEFTPAAMAPLSFTRLQTPLLPLEDCAFLGCLWWG